MQTGYAWDIATRTGALPDPAGRIVVHEFDYKQENVVVYQENGVTIRSWPAIHSLDGSVSFSLEWNGLKYVFGGDTYPNKWYMEFAAGADVASHECFLPPKALAAYFGWDLAQATYVSTRDPQRAPGLWKGHGHAQTATWRWVITRCNRRRTTRRS